MSVCPSVRRLVRWWARIKNSRKSPKMLSHCITPHDCCNIASLHMILAILHHLTWLMQYCIILNKLSSMWTHRCTPGVLVQFDLSCIYWTWPNERNNAFGSFFWSVHHLNNRNAFFFNIILTWANSMTLIFNFTRSFGFMLCEA